MKRFILSFWSTFCDMLPELGGFLGFATAVAVVALPLIIVVFLLVSWMSSNWPVG